MVQKLDIQGLDEGERRVRDPTTGRNVVVPGDMTYQEWEKGKRAEGKSAGGGAVYPGKPGKVGSVDFSNKDNVKNALNKAEDELQGLKHEVNYSITTDGSIWRVDGYEDTVNPGAIPVSLKGSYSYHNHPGVKTNYSFSAEDTAFFISEGESYSRASDDIFDYEMRRTEQTVEKSYDEVYHRFWEIYKSQTLQKAWDGEIDIDLDGYHETMKVISREYAFEYERSLKNVSR